MPLKTCRAAYERTGGSELAGRQGVPLPAFRRLADFGCPSLTPSVFGASARSDFAAAFSLWLPDSASPSAMTLEMTLAANVSGVPLIENVRESTSSPLQQVNTSALVGSHDAPSTLLWRHSADISGQP